jgi:hypothetical protein
MPTAHTQPSHPSTATLQALVLAYKETHKLWSQQCELFEKLEALPPRTKNKKALVADAHKVLRELSNKNYTAYCQAQEEFAKTFCDNAKRFEQGKEFRSLMFSTLVSDSLKNVCGLLLQSIRNAYKERESVHSFKYSDCELLLEVSCDFDGTPSRVRISTPETKNAWGLFTIHCATYNLYSTAPAYYAKSCSMDFKTSQSLAEYSAGSQVARWILECMQTTSFVSVASKEFEQAFESMVKGHAPAPEAEASE